MLTSRVEASARDVHVEVVCEDKGGRGGAKLARWPHSIYMCIASLTDQGWKCLTVVLFVCAESEDDLVAELRGFWSDDDWSKPNKKDRYATTPLLQLLHMPCPCELIFMD